MARKAVLAILAFWFVAGAAGAPAEDGSGSRIEVGGFSTPESVLYDPDQDVYLVSNIEGNPGDEDGKGFISRVSPDGKILDLRWIAGGKGGVTLSAPKGTAIVGDLLYATDIRNVRIFDRKTGAPKGSVAIPDARFLNDAAPDGQGGVLVTDSGAGTVYRIGADGKAAKIAEGKDLLSPNGVAVTPKGDRLLCTMAGAEVYTLAEKGKGKPAWATPKGGLDGLVVLPDGSLLVSSWEGKAVYRLTADDKVESVVEGVTSPADIGYDGKRGRILIPVFQENRVLIHPYAPKR